MAATGMVPAMLLDSELRRACARIATPPQRAVATIIARAVARGEIPAPADPDMVAAVLPALGLQRLIFTGQTPDTAFIDAVIENVVLPALMAGTQARATKRTRSTRKD